MASDINDGLSKRSRDDEKGGCEPAHSRCQKKARLKRSMNRVTFSPGGATCYEVGPCESRFSDSVDDDLLDKSRFCTCQDGCSENCQCAQSEIKCFSLLGRGCGCLSQGCQNIHGRSEFDPRAVARHSKTVLESLVVGMRTRSRGNKGI